MHSASAGTDPELGGGGGGWSCMLLLHPVLTCSGGVSPSAVGTKTPLAPAGVSPIATYASGVFSSTHWRRYWTYTRATCTVWWLYEYIHMCKWHNDVYSRISL